MKTSLFDGVLKRIVRRGSRSRNGIQRAMNARTTLALEKWVMDKDFCLVETMDEIADRLGISKSQLSDYCHVVVRDNFPTWRKKLRIMEAQRLWKEDPSLTVVMVAALVGIQDKSNFRRQFFEVTGQNVSKWLGELKDRV